VSITWVLVVIGVVTLALLLAAAVSLFLMRGDTAARALVRRITHLPLRAKFRLAMALMRDSRIPLIARAIPALLILYLAMPIDIIPDFIPVLGQLDDLVITLFGVGALLRLTPRQVLEDHVARLETEA
jgi:uncharacterized membrane protein YkvA (DUF1232 family)